MKSQMMKVAKTFSTVEELYASQEYKNIFSGYENNIGMDKHVRARHKFIAAYVVETNPETNYGRSADVYEYFEIEGMLRLMKIQLGSSIDNGPFQLAKILDTGFLYVGAEGYEKSASNRAICRKNNLIVF